jgi:hypothetical protein
MNRKEDLDFYFSMTVAGDRLVNWFMAMERFERKGRVRTTGYPSSSRMKHNDRRDK